MRAILYIGNLGSHENVRELHRMLSRHGAVRKVKVAAHQDILRRGNGFGVGELQSRKEAGAAIAALHRRRFNGGLLNVRWARENEQSLLAAT